MLVSVWSWVCVAILVILNKGSVSISSARTSSSSSATSPPSSVPISHVFPLKLPVIVKALTRVSPVGILSVT